MPLPPAPCSGLLPCRGHGSNTATPTPTAAAASARPRPTLPPPTCPPPLLRYGPDRKLYLPGGLLDRAEVNPALNGTLAGDYGYDPLGLATDAETVEKYRKYELIHARWAMLGAAGAIIPEGLAANGADIKGATWFETGAAMLNGGTLNYFAVPWALVSNPLPLFVVAAIEVALIGAAENYRRTGELLFTHFEWESGWVVGGGGGHKHKAQPARARWPPPLTAPLTPPHPETLPRHRPRRLLPGRGQVRLERL
jgi:hypothetical protein